MTTTIADDHPGLRGPDAAGPQRLYVVLQILLLVLVVRLLEIEQRRELFTVLAIAIAGAPLHARLPARWQGAFFVALTALALIIVLGALSALAVLGIGSLLIGICYLPIGWWLRVGLIVAVAAGLVLLRRDSSNLFWPVVGSMLMFRLIVFLYDTRRMSRPPALRDVVPYFFLLPNVCFVLFPVVDFATWQQTRTNPRSSQLWQSGANWMVLGVLHLLIYRAIRYWILPPPGSMENLPALLLFLAANYGLYLRVSGQFHLIIGILHLYGYALPRTHHWFFLASSFSDIWRRINIYWKDFMSKLFFMPAFFRLRGTLGDRWAIVAAVCWAFLATWLAHSWQAFWLLGAFPLTVLDAQLWLAAGSVVAVNALLDYRRARRPRSEEPHTLARAALHTLQIMGTFLVVSGFWMRWTNPGLLLQLHEDIGLGYLFDREQVLKAAGILFGVLLCGIVAHFVVWRAAGGKTQQPAPDLADTSLRRISANLCVLTVLTLVGLPTLPQHLPIDAARIVLAIRSDSFSQTEASQLVQGYYEQLNEGSIQAGLFAGANRTDDGVEERRRLFTEFTRFTRDIRQLELIPGLRRDYMDTTITINRWGMRDREIDQEKPPHTRRIAVLGSSMVMGFGVDDDHTFCRLLEEQLNADDELTPDPQQCQVLNFGCGKYYAIHRRAHLEVRALDFDPDVVLYVAHQDEPVGVFFHLADLARYGLVDDSCLQQILDEEGIDEQTPYGVIRNRLRERALDILRCSYERIVRVCRERRITPVWVYLPMPGGYQIPVPGEVTMTLARDAGFEVLDLSDWHAGHAAEEVKLSERDDHANALGHELIAARILEALGANPQLLRSHQGRN